jgi:hypothetical protein
MGPSKLPKLIAGVDYYIDDGKFVFTAAYHLKRGFCCNSRCRHCPYKEDHELPNVIVTGLPGKPRSGDG